MDQPTQTTTGGLRRLVGKISRKNRILMGIVGGSAMIGATLLATAPQHDPSVVEEKAWPVSTLRVERQTLSPELQLFGKIRQCQQAAIENNRRIRREWVSAPKRQECQLPDGSRWSL